MRNEVKVGPYVAFCRHRNPLGHARQQRRFSSMMISDVPFGGPVACCCRVGFVDGELVVNPTLQQMEVSTLRFACGRHQSCPPYV
jgi:polyribonucleotide nucleotidyltransferase